ncbi:MAG: amino acid permease [bacterium]|nr:amino acid permease [bacterium]
MSHQEPNLENPTHITLARTLGPGSITMLGIGALLGGGIFTLLGPAAGLVGPGLFLSMILGAGVAFLNLQMYLALGTTFPEAGGGYNWVRKGLGNFQGFLAGWLDWFAHAAACGVYALSFGFYAHQFLQIIGFKFHLGFNLEWFSNEKIIAAVAVLIFGYINWRGTKTTGKASNYITACLITILTLFIGFGAYKIFTSPQPLVNFTPLLPSGLLGIIAATAFFYIAFEGSEIQVQASEETKNPKRDLKIGLLSSWGVVALFYILVSLIMVGATVTQEGTAIGELLSSFGEGAIVKSASQFMPFGGFIMVVGGLLANLAALNATIYSSSHVSFALARDKNIWSRLSQIHLKNLTPHVAIVASTILIAIMVLSLPLFDVAAAASLVFVLLFLQLNIAGINIHFRWPKIKWNYKIPFFPVTPMLAIIIYAALAITMLQINLTAWVITIVWALIGLVNYFSYAQAQSREQFEKEIIYEEAIRVGPKTGKRILLPIAPDISKEELKNLSEIAFALASHLNGEIIFVIVHEVHPSIPLTTGANVKHDRQTFEDIKIWAEEFNQKTPGIGKDINLHNLIMVGRDVVDIILDIVKMEDCDLLILNWEGYTQTKGTVFGSKIDRILRESKCDLLVVKQPSQIKSLLVAADPAANNPYLPAAGEIFTGLVNYFKPQTEFLSILKTEVPFYLKPDPSLMLKPLGLKKKDFNKIEFFKDKSVVTAIIEEVKRAGVDTVLITASRPKFLKEIRFGNVPEMLSKHMDASLMIVKGHQGIAEAFWERFIRKLSRR